MTKKTKLIVGTITAAAISIAAVFFALSGAHGAFSDARVYVQPLNTLMGNPSWVQNRYMGVVESQETWDVNLIDNQTVKEIFVKVGDEVSEGSVLFEYDQNDINLKISQAKLELEEIGNEIQGYQTQINELNAEKANASQDEQFNYTVQIQSLQTSIFHIKHTDYSLQELLDDPYLAKSFTGGTAYVFRLTPAHFHRYIWSVSGCLVETKHISGILHSVQPVCHENYKIFVQNTREYSRIVIPSIGEVIQMEIGALLVGQIANHSIDLGEIICAGDEKGFFEYGGSSIVLITSDRTELSEKLKHRRMLGNEIPVVIGERLTQ